MVGGILGSAACVPGMFYASTLTQLTVSFTLVQLFMTAAAAPFNGLVADLVHASQRGMVR